jgi:hemolysin III
VDEALVPRLRGVFHLWSFFAAVAAGTVLVALADDFRERLAWRTAVARMWARRLDHSTIFVFIAGTYTPFVLLGLGGALQIGMLVAVWGGAALGLVLNLAWIAAPRWLSTVAYLAVGWVGVIAVPELFGLGVAAAVLVVVGAGLYTLGALAYATRWPNPFPASLGFHEIFHLLVVAAAVTQFVAVSLVVLA